MTWPSFISVPRWRAEHQGDHPAFIFLADGEREVRRLTYAEMDYQARSVAAWLQSRELVGERVLLLYPPGLDFVIGFLGCLYAGSVAVPAYPPHPRRADPRLTAIMDDCRPGAALCVQSDRALLDRLLADRQLALLATDDVADLGEARADGWQEPRCAPDTLAYLQYTSGSTGEPKGVMVTHGNLLHQAEYLLSICRYDSSSVHVSWQPFFHDMGLVGSLVEPVYSGALAVIMSPAAFLRNPIRWLQAISKYRGTGVTAPNFAFDLCVTGTTPAQREGLDLSSWEGAWNGAEPIRADVLDRFSEVYEPYGFRRRTHLPSYGMAETTLCVTASRLDRLPLIASFEQEALEQNQVVPCASDATSATRLVGSGLVGGGLDVAIVDPDTLVRCPDNRIGEIWVAGDSVAQGYWQRPDLTEATFHARISDSNEGPYLRTGDLGFLHDGELFVTGRLKDMLIIRGRNLYPQDIELIAQQSHDALQANTGAAFSVDVDGREVLALALEVKRTERNRVDADEVFEAVRRAVGEHFGVDAHWVGLVQPNRIPRTSSGKVMRRACRQQHLSGELPLLAEWRPAGGDEQQVAAAPDDKSMLERLRASNPSARRLALVSHLQTEIAHALELRNAPDPQTGFERLGIDSMAAVELVNRLHDQLEGAVDLPTTLLFDQPNIEAVARYVEDSLFGREEQPAGPARPEQALNEPVAVVGLACRFPGAADAEAFWQVLDQGIDAIREVPDERWDISAHFDEEPGIPGKMYSRFGGFIDEIDGFDAAFFDLSPREAVSMDPQHRHLLEVSWLALEDAGIAPRAISGRPVGVFVGISTGDYQQVLADQGDRFTDAFMATGNAPSAAVGRLSFVLGLQGPCVSVDTACSSSLVAVHQAVQSLRLGECEAALAGGVNAVLRPEITSAFCNARLLAPDGRCKTFDAAADGYVRSEGCGIVVLKRLHDAQRDGDRILAVIRGSAINQDGRSSGLTAPNGPSQTRVISDALAAGGVAPADVQYLECHGTGTVLGDPIEVQAADAILSAGREQDSPLLIGSVKTNLGHLEAAAGIAGLIKVILALQHERIPPSLHFRSPNPRIPWDSLNVEVVNEPRAWTADAHTRIAGVSSFGFAGSNAHVVIEEAPPRPAQTSVDPSGPGPWLLAISARTENALQDLVGRYRAWLRAHPATSLPEICHTANTGREHFEHRAVLVSEGREALHQQLDALAQRRAAAGATLGVVNRNSGRRVAFLFPGEGLQYAGMGRELYESEPVFRACVDRCAEVYGEHGDPGALKALMFDPRSNPEPAQTRHIRPALYTLQVSLAALWRSWGVVPDAVLGHSAGEYAAACVAGVFGLEDGLRLVIERGRLMESLPPGGGMLSVTAPADRVEAALVGDEGACVSAYNGLNTVVSGTTARLDSLQQSFDEQGLYCARLPATNAAHSMFVDPILDDFEAFARRIDYAAPSRTLVSAMTGAVLGASEIPDAAYWRAQTRQPVRFAQAVRTLFETVACDVVLELGPQAELMWLARMCWRPEHKVLWASSLAKDRAARSQMLSSAAQLHANGVSLDFAGMRTVAHQPHRLALPAYPFQHESYWAGPMGGEALAGLGDSLYQVQWESVEAGVEQPRQSWLVLAQDASLGDEVGAALRGREQGPVTIVTLAGDEVAVEGFEAMLQKARQSGPIDHLVLLAGPVTAADADGEAVHRAQTTGVNSALLAARALISARVSARLWLVTHGAHAVLEGESVDPTHSTLWGFGRTFGAEHPDRYGGMIDLPLLAEVSDRAAMLADALVRDDGENQIALRGGQRLVARLQHYTVPRATPERLEANATYLITGGTGSLGLALTRHLCECGAKQIVLTSRSGANDAVLATIQELADAGCRVEVVKADVAIPAQAELLLERIDALADGCPLRGIIHAAGVLEGAPSAEQTLEALARVLAPKVWGAWNLHRLTAEKAIELDFFVLFSSGSSLLGLRGHSNYSAANAYLDSLAQHRRSRGLPGVSINWGPWAEAGMATRMEAGSWEEMGTRLMQPRTAMRAFDRIVFGEAAQVCVQPMNLSRWSELARTGRLPPVLLKLLQPLLSLDQAGGARAGAPVRVGASKKVGALVGRLAGLGPAARRAALQTHISEQIGAVLGLPAEKIDPEAGFFDMGMNSIMAVQLRDALESGLDGSLDLPAAVVFNHPTVRKMSAYLATALFPAGDAQPIQPALQVADAAAATAAARRFGMSELAEATEQLVEEVLGTDDWTADADESSEDVRNRKTLAAILALRAELNRLQSRVSDPLAVVGLSCRYPGGDGPEGFWRMLDEGRDCITEVPAERWSATDFYDVDPDAPGKMNTRQGGFLSGIDLFDASFFDISPREARSLDPQQRILLEVAWEALESANLPPRRLRDARGGVFVGISVSDYVERVAAQGLDNLDAYVGTGNALSAAAGRLAFTLGWHGPALAIDTACSSSLVALHEACTSLRAGECDIALAGGVSLVLNPTVSLILSKAHMLSPDDRCKTFDAAANGYVRGEGCGIVVLKRLSDAQRDGDRILALIRGTAVNQDGRSSGLTVPNGLSQEQVILDALHSAGVEPAAVQYLEAHGTGTPLGDPIEVQAADSVLSKGRDPQRPLVVGSVKTNIGHTESAAGIAGVIKVILAMQHERIPKSLHFQTPNPHIPWEQLNVKVAADAVPWPSGPERRIADVSSFGFVGTNAHVVVEEAPATEPAVVAEPERPGRCAHLLTISARSEAALSALAGRYAERLARDVESSLLDLCHAANTGRDHFEERAALVFGGREQLQAQLAGLQSAQTPSGVMRGRVSLRSGRRTVFLFTGQGSQFVGMGRALYDTEPVFRACFDRCVELFRGLRSDAADLREVVFEESETDRLRRTEYTQPALYALEVSLLALWRDWGVEPDVVLGHSVGEYSAAHAAGVFSLEDGMRLITERGRLMQSLPAGGAMAAVSASSEVVQSALHEFSEVCIGAYNGADTVISGTQAQVEALIGRFEEQGLRCNRLRTSHAFHSALMDPILDEFRTVASSVTFRPPTKRLLSNVDGQVIEDDRVLDADYWTSHIRQAVHFEHSIRSLEQLGCDIMVEIGPHPVLIGMGQRCWSGDKSPLWVPTLRRGRDDTRQMLSAAGSLHTGGVELDFVAMDAPWQSSLRQVTLPFYPFQRQRHWVKAPPPVARPTGPRSAEYLYRVNWKPLDAQPNSVDAGKLETWLILSDRGGVGAALRDRLESSGRKCVYLAPGKGMTLDIEALHEAIGAAQADPSAPLAKVIHLSSLDGSEPDSFSELRDAQERGVLSAHILAQSLLGSARPAALWLVTRGVHRVIDSDGVDPTHAPLWGLGKSIALAHPEIWGGMLDLPSVDDPKSVGESIMQALSADDGEDHVALRQGQRWAARLEADADVGGGKPLNVDAAGTYLITGGAGAIGLRIAARLVERGARHLVLSGRSAPDATANEQIRALEANGCEVRMIRADVSQEADVTRLFDDIDASGMPRLAGIFHAAGMTRIGPFDQLSRQQFIEVMGPKVWGGWLLEHELSSRGLAPSLFVCVSSVAAVLGAGRQADYAAANMYLDALMTRRQLDGAAGCSIDFGPWGEAGMSADDETSRQMKLLGFNLFKPDVALDAMEEVIGAGRAVSVVADVNWSSFRDLAEAQRPRPLLEALGSTDVADAAQADSSSSPAPLVTQLTEAAPEARVEMLTQVIKEELARVLERPVEDIADDMGFFDLGMDSLMAIEFRDGLSRQLGQVLSATVVMDRPDIGTLTAYLIEELLGLPLIQTRQDAKRSADEDTAVDTTESEVHGLSAGEVASALDDELKEILGE
ncbi:MAG: SDR family NAD(P)-dependent oxidoreductase [Gammaproteobacteria bacterium]|nr:SDR family NAD(P)-dependent oxidoreductase [Gammaproteobacteria bacterium]